MSNLASDLLFGVAVADALGVPVEFKSPTEINIVSVQSNYQDISNRFAPFGSWNKPVGTFSDDSSLTFCTAEYLAAGQTDLNDLMDLFKNWLKQGYWTTDGHTFDVGRTTLLAIENFANDYNWRTAGLNTERDNGNGSLMRIAPLLLPLLYDKTITNSYQFVSDFSSVTHAHPISVDSCFIYLQYAKHLYQTKDTTLALVRLKEELALKYDNNAVFKRLFSEEFLSLDPSIFNPNGFVVGSLEIALYTLLTTTSYEEAVLKAISLGKDTDTNAAITGALAGILYGYDSIPLHWIEPLKRKEDIEILAKQLKKTYTIKQILQLEKDSDFQKLVNDLKEPNLFNVLKLDRYEIRHSTFLAWLLDPNEKHCLDDVFLNLFLSDIVKDKDLLNQAKFKWIKRETENDIDIFIEFDNMIIAVENKIDSDEHSDQLTKYTQYLKTVYPHISNQFLVFLTPNGKLPKKNNEYIVYSYSQIAHHITKILETEHFKINTRARIYIEDYLHSINENLMKNNPENILAAELYAKYKDTFDFIMKNVESDLNYITNKFNHFLLHKLPNYVKGSEDYSFSRFTTREINDILTPVKSGKRAWKNKEPFLFEISLEKEERRIVFLLSVSDFDQSLNQCLHEIFMQQGLICANENSAWKIYNNIAIPFDFDEFKNDSYIESKFEEIYKIAEPIILKVQDIIITNKNKFEKSKL